MVSAAKLKKMIKQYQVRGPIPLSAIVEVLVEDTAFDGVPEGLRVKRVDDPGWIIEAGDETDFLSRTLVRLTIEQARYYFGPLPGA